MDDALNSPQDLIESDALSDKLLMSRLLTIPDVDEELHQQSERFDRQSGVTAAVGTFALNSTTLNLAKRFSGITLDGLALGSGSQDGLRRSMSRPMETHGPSSLFWLRNSNGGRPPSSGNVAAASSMSRGQRHLTGHLLGDRPRSMADLHAPQLPNSTPPGPGRLSADLSAGPKPEAGSPVIPDPVIPDTQVRSLAAIDESLLEAANQGGRTKSGPTASLTPAPLTRSDKRSKGFTALFSCWRRPAASEFYEDPGVASESGLKYSQLIGPSHSVAASSKENALPHASNENTTEASKQAAPCKQHPASASASSASPPQRSSPTDPYSSTGSQPTADIFIQSSLSCTPKTMAVSASTPPAQSAKMPSAPEAADLATMPPLGSTNHQHPDEISTSECQN